MVVNLQRQRVDIPERAAIFACNSLSSDISLSVTEFLRAIRQNNVRGDTGCCGGGSDVC